MIQLCSNTDEAVLFGDCDHLVGVVHHPVCSVVADDFAILLLTPGMLHSVGPFRMHVDLARELGKAGLRSMRFDLSGIGESLAVGTPGDSLSRAASEITAAIDFLFDRYGVRRVALFGLCSGADDAIHAALEDQRIAGVFATDGCGYRTRRFYWQRAVSHYLPKILSARKWLRSIRRAFGSRSLTPATLQMGDDIREFPSREESVKQLRALADRNVQLHFHYTGGVGEYYNYEAQFGDMFPELRGERAISSSFQPESDHVALLCEHRAGLVQLAVRKLCAFRTSGFPV